MITINLLSPGQKRELKNKRIYVAVKELVMLILLFTSIIAIMLLISRYFLDNRLAALVEKNSLIVESNREIINKISTLNTKIDGIEKIQKNFIKWSRFIGQISAVTPGGISYGAIKIDYNSLALEIAGTARTRNDLTAFRDNLTKLESLANVTLPLKDLLAKANNRFTIKADIVLNKL